MTDPEPQVGTRPPQAPERRRRRRGGRSAEQAMVPDAEFTSYYGRPVIKEPVWKEPDVPAYLFLGGLAGASSVLAAGAQLSGHRELARVSKVAALGAISLSAVALVHDLGRPDRFLHMLRVFKPTSPMSVGSWLLAAYGPVAGAAALSDLTGILRPAGVAATAGAAVLGPAIATYTAALICDTAVPAWHEAHREMPYVFAGSAASAAGGLGMLLTHPSGAAPARDLAILGASVELIAKRRLLSRLKATPGQDLAEPYEEGRTAAVLRTAEVLTAAGLAGAVLSSALIRGASRSGGGVRGGVRGGRAVAVLSGTALVTASALTRHGIFKAGLASARDPKYTIRPQRARATSSPS
jgi:formate-dependent nitrite reductase membrane component NrfD